MQAKRDAIINSRRVRLIFHNHIIAVKIYEKKKLSTTRDARRTHRKKKEAGRVSAKFSFPTPRRGGGLSTHYENGSISNFDTLFSPRAAVLKSVNKEKVR